MKAARARWPLAILIVVAATHARAEKLTIALSTSDIGINSSFTGTHLAVFGVIEPDADNAAPAATGDYQVAVLMTGPRQSVVARRKDRVLGIWANRGAQTILAPLTFYALHTSGPIETLAGPAVLDRLQIGFDNVPFITPGGLVNDPDAAEFRDAYIRLKEEAGLFSEAVDVGFLGKTVFRTTIVLPASIAVGDYTAVAYVFAGGELVAHASEQLQVLQTGFEDILTRFSHGQSLAYGIICVVIALFIGWLGGVIFRRD